MQTFTGFLLLLVGLNFTLAADEKAYFMAGGKLRLDPRPAPTEPTATILWKFKGNLVAELVDVSAPLDVYDTFKGRTTVDKKTGRLEISSMTAADAGVYTVEINNRVQPGGYDAEMIKAVTEPEVAFKPLSCAPPMDMHRGV
ncbi:uncharacterized protein LOC121955047 [Plectropomus leopardus]|uniref:uncharacterized protein LOC121955047 n=1 Tax=Plectropomus leopardus TaxID=160734 RepID=UPI001C4CE053|nr:uncharacterized protein LOC121955047 [Plectropomus leopardus]